MKNIPVFTGQHGIASLIFREVPVCGRAYILVRSVWNGETAAFLEECGQFCRAVGAQEIYASWNLEALPAEPAYDMLRMNCEKDSLPQLRRAVELEPLTPENSGQYQEIYNRCFREILSAASCDLQDLRKLYGEERAWLAKVDGRFAGLAEISEQGLESLAVLPEYRGLGYDLALTVLPMVPRRTVELRVCSVNARAIGLYRRLGFYESGIISHWWKLEK